MAQKSWFSVFGMLLWWLQLLHASMGGVGKELMTAGQQFSWYRHSSEEAAREGVCGAREAGMHARFQEHTKEHV